MNKEDIEHMKTVAANLKAKLKVARDTGPGDYEIILTPEEAMIAWRAIFGDLSNGHR